VDESWLLPVVVQLGGSPVVSDGGDILYVFPDLMTSVADTSNSLLMNLLHHANTGRIFDIDQQLTTTTTNRKAAASSAPASIMKYPVAIKEREQIFSRITSSEQVIALGSHTAQSKLHAPQHAYLFLNSTSMN
jgi:autotransporter translocation and assembly factor TamB